MSASAAVAVDAPWPPASCQPPLIRRGICSRAARRHAARRALRGTRRLRVACSGTAVTSACRKVRGARPRDAESSAAVRIGAGDLCVGRHPVVGMRRPLLGGQQRQQRGQRIDRKGLPRREVQVLADQSNQSPAAMIADHRAIGGDHVDAQVEERETVVCREGRGWHGANDSRARVCSSTCPRRNCPAPAPSAPLQFYGGTDRRAGALPVCFSRASTASPLHGAPDEKGFWPVLWGARSGWLLARIGIAMPRRCWTA